MRRAMKVSTIVQPWLMAGYESYYDSPSRSDGTAPSACRGLMEVAQTDVSQIAISPDPQGAVPGDSSGPANF